MPPTLLIIEVCQVISNHRPDARVTCRRVHIRENPQSFHSSQRRRSAPARVTLQARSKSSVAVLELCHFRHYRIATAVCEVKRKESALKRPRRLANKTPALENSSRLRNVGCLCEVLHSARQHKNIICTIR
jgi:hypothetical protein